MSPKAAESCLISISLHYIINNRCVTCVFLIASWKRRLWLQIVEFYSQTMFEGTYTQMYILYFIFGLTLFVKSRANSTNSAHLKIQFDKI